MRKTILVAGAGGFIGGHLVKRFLDQGHAVRAVDIKPLEDWYQVHRAAVNNTADLSDPKCCAVFTSFVDEVYNLAADMGGMGFIETHRVECLRSVLINTNLIEAAWRANVKKYFFASSACVYNTNLQQQPGVTALKESDAYPAMAERGYGWEKLFSEMMCQEYAHERGLPTFIARFHNVYGPHGTWDGGREKAPAAICRKVLEALEEWPHIINIWGGGKQTRSFMFIDDCINGIERIADCPALVATPINLGSSELVSIDDLVTMVEGLAGTGPTLQRCYPPGMPTGVQGRNSDNTLIKQHLRWEPSTPLVVGMTETFEWIKEQYEARKAQT